jgi:hypothetical protein
MTTARRLIRSTLAVAASVAAASVALTAQTPPQSFKGLQISVASVARSTTVSLGDCPPGANSQRGVIKPGDPREFAVVTVNVTVLPAFQPGPLPKPVLHGPDGASYNTAQAFTDVGATPEFACTFAFRVPTGAAVTRLQFDTLSIDLTPVTK